MNPLISVIIPVCNVEKYLQECLESVFSQGYKDFEVICINDGSRDGSFAILEKYQRNHQNMHVYSNFKNSGQSYTRNRGMELADGRYIFFLDADDTIAEDTFSLLAGKVEATEADIILFDYEEVYEDDVSGLFSFKRKRQDGRYKDFLGTYIGRDLLSELAEKKVYAGMVYVSLYKRGFIEEKNLHFYEGIVHEDTLFVFLLWWMPKM